MAKKGKKRQRSSASPEQDCHINITTELAADSIESCLADLEEATNPLYAKESKENEGNAGKSVDAEGSQSGVQIPPEFPFDQHAADVLKERLTTWNSAFDSWTKNGSKNYTPGLLPCFETELARHFQMKGLSKFLLEACSDLKMPAFERWLLDSKLEERQLKTNIKSISAAAAAASQRPKKQKKVETYNDPVLPCQLSLSSASSQRLIEEICETGTAKDDAIKIFQDLCTRTKAALQEITSQHFRCKANTPFKSDRIEIERGSYLVSLLYSRKKWKSPFIIKITISHYEKLKTRFLNMHKKVIREKDLDTSSKKRTKAMHALHLLIMVITLRYSSLSGGQLLDDFRGGGMQGAINEQGFDVLRSFFPESTLFECFASPLNVSLPVFASAFEELDWHFGSVGDLAFSESFYDSCCCEANPPFTPGFMEFLADFIKTRVKQANKDNKSLSFVVIVPSVKDLNVEKRKGASAVKRFAAKAHQQMVECPSCTLHIVLPAKEHGYVEGAQHLRPTRYKRSLYDTSVILLQSEKAQSTMLDKTKFESSIREAFAERHSEEREKRARPVT